MNLRIAGMCLGIGIGMTAALPAGAAEVHFGVAGITGIETARLSAFCSNESPSATTASDPCDVTFIFHDLAGRIFKQATMTLAPGTGGSLDLRGSEIGTARRSEIVPCIKVGRGGAFGNVQIFDNFTQRTRVATNYADRAQARTGELHFGLAGITPFDTLRVNAFCAADAIRSDGGAGDPCDVTFIFHDLAGRIFKQASMTLLPGQAGFLDVRAAEIGLTARRGEIVPCVRVARGGAVTNFEMIDTFTGLTLLLANPAALMTP